MLPDPRSRILSTLRADARRRIIGPALPWAEPGEGHGLARLLIDTHDPTCIGQVIAHARELDEPTLDLLLTLPDSPLTAALRQVLAGRSAGIDRRVSRVICERPRPCFAPLMCELLLRQLPRSTTDALSCALIIVAEQVHNQHAQDGERDTVERAVIHLIETHHAHRVHDVAIAGLILAVESGQALEAAMAAEDGVVLAGLRRGLRFTDHPSIAGRIFHMAARREIGRAAARRLADLSVDGWRAALSRSAHMLACHQARLSLRHVDRPVRSLPPRDVWAQLPPEAQAQLPRLIDAVGLSPVALEQALRDLLTLDSPLARIRAIEAMAQLRDTRLVLSDHLTDRDPLVARAAFTALQRSGGVGLSTWRRALRSTDVWLAGRARRELAQESAEQYFAHWLLLSEAERFSIAHRLVAADRGTFEQHLMQHMRSGERAERLHAIRLARRVGIVPRVQPIIIELTEVADPFVASSAVAALVEVDPDTRTQALRCALEHHHPRVRANAIEVLGYTSDDHATQCARQYIVDRDNRLRANAIVSTIRANDITTGGGALASMLRDDDPMHRISALWAARALGRGAFLREIRAMASVDPVPEVRERAERTARVLMSFKKSSGSAS